LTINLLIAVLITITLNSSVYAIQFESCRCKINFGPTEFIQSIDFDSSKKDVAVESLERGYQATNYLHSNQLLSCES